MTRNDVSAVRTKREGKSVIGSIRQRAGRWILPMLVLATFLGSMGPVLAQSEVSVDTAQSVEILTTLGLPEIAINVGPEGVTAPSNIEAGRYLISLTAAEPYVAYVDFMQPPASLPLDEALASAKGAASNDLAQLDRSGCTQAGTTPFR